MNHFIDTIFPNNVVFKENKRYKTDTDKKILTMIKRGLFDEAIPIKNTLCKWFRSTKTVRSENNV